MHRFRGVAGIKSEYLAGMPRNLHAAALVEALSDGFGDVLVQGRNPLPLPSGVKSGLLGHFFYCRAGSEYDGWLRSTASRIECDQSRRATPPLDLLPRCRAGSEHDGEDFDRAFWSSVDWMCYMHLCPAGPAAALDRYIDYWRPCATSHDELRCRYRGSGRDPQRGAHLGRLQTMEMSTRLFRPRKVSNCAPIRAIAQHDGIRSSVFYRRICSFSIRSPGRSLPPQELCRIVWRRSIDCARDARDDLFKSGTGICGDRGPLHDNRGDRVMPVQHFRLYAHEALSAFVVASDHDLPDRLDSDRAQRKSFSMRKNGVRKNGVGNWVRELPSKFREAKTGASVRPAAHSGKSRGSPRGGRPSAA